MSWKHHRAVLANAERRGDTETAASARRDLRYEKLREHAIAVVDGSPALTDEQVAELAGLFSAAGGDRAA